MNYYLELLKFNKEISLTNENFPPGIIKNQDQLFNDKHTLRSRVCGAPTNDEAKT